MKFDPRQAKRIAHEILIHASYNNQHAIRCLDQWLDHGPNLNAAQAFEAMLENGDPFLTEIVAGMVLNTLSETPTT